jgi:hypothetical protein
MAGLPCDGWELRSYLNYTVDYTTESNLELKEVWSFKTLLKWSYKYTKKDSFNWITRRHAALIDFQERSGVTYAEFCAIDDATCASINNLSD